MLILFHFYKTKMYVADALFLVCNVNSVCSCVCVCMYMLPFWGVLWYLIEVTIFHFPTDYLWWAFCCVLICHPVYLLCCFTFKHVLLILKLTCFLLMSLKNSLHILDRITFLVSDLQIFPLSLLFVSRCPLGCLCHSKDF